MVLFYYYGYSNKFSGQHRPYRIGSLRPRGFPSGCFPPAFVILCCVKAGSNGTPSITLDTILCSPTSSFYFSIWTPFRVRTTNFRIQGWGASRCGYALIRGTVRNHNNLNCFRLAKFSGYHLWRRLFSVHPRIRLERGLLGNEWAYCSYLVDFFHSDTDYYNRIKYTRTLFKASFF